MVKAAVLGLLLILIQIGENFMNYVHTQFTYVPRDWTLVCLNIFKALEIKSFQSSINLSSTMTRLFPHGRDQGNEGEEGLGVVEEEEVVIFMVEGLAVG